MSDKNSLNERLAFAGLDSKARGALAGVRPVVERALSGSLDRFYDQVRRFPETARFFTGPAHMAGAKAAQGDHWKQIAAAKFDDGYVAAVRRIGAAHAQIGLEPRWYIGGYAVVLEGLIEAIVRDHEARRSLWRKGDGGAGLGAALSSVVKAALIDMDLSISIYLETVQKAREEAEARRAEAEQMQRRVVERTAAALSKLAEGDLTGRIEEVFGGEHEALRADFNGAMDRLEAAMAEISAAASAMLSGAGEISQAADDLSQRTERQAATLEETAAALDEITATVRRTADGSARASAVVLAAKADAEKSGEVVGDAVKAMGAIEKSAEQIGQIIGVIDEIAFQTNLLALNAGVEAARAGDAGKGFAVVASEVRALAQRSAEAAKEIKALISASGAQVKSGVSLVGQTGEALSAIVARVAEINGLVGEITASAREQATALAEVNSAVNQMDQATQQNAAMVEQSTAASHGLTQEAGQLNGLVSRFRVRAAAPGRNASLDRSRARLAAFVKEQAAPRREGKPALALAAKADWEEF